MKTCVQTKLSRALVACSGIALLSFALAGCSTTGYKRGDAAAKSFQYAAIQVQEESQALTATIRTLDTMTKQPAADLKPQFRQYNRALNRLEKCVARNESAAVRLAAKNYLYLQHWDNQLTNINYETVRASSEARKTDVTNQYQAVNQRYTEAREVMQPLLKYLNDIRRALDTDLTPAGLNALQPVVANAEENATKVQQALGRLTSELASSGARMSTVAFRSVAHPTTNTVTATGR